MKRENFARIITPVFEYYARQVTDAAIAVYFEAIKELDEKTFEQCLWRHVRDPNQGQFFPTAAHIVAQICNDATISARLNSNFDSDPCIDGTSRFDAARESHTQRDIRRKRYIAKCLDQVKSMPLQKRATLLLADNREV